MIFITFFTVIITVHSALTVLRVISVTSLCLVRTRKPPASLEKTSWTSGDVFICWDDHWGSSWRMFFLWLLNATAQSWRREWQPSILAWRISWTEEPGELWSVGSQRVGHNWATPAHTHRHCTVIVISEVGITHNKDSRKHKPSPSDRQRILDKLLISKFIAMVKSCIS